MDWRAARGSTSTSAEELQFEIKPDSAFHKLAFLEIFQNSAPVEVDLGSGSGMFLIGAARQYPERNFLGVERLLGRVRKARRQAYQLNLPNVRVLRWDVLAAVKDLFPAGGLSRCHLSFPDPWPKRRHHPRRLVTREFFEAVAEALECGGELRIKTDHGDYFAHITKILAGAQDLFQFAPWGDDPYPSSEFELRFQARGIPVHRMRLCKVSRRPRFV